MKKELTRKQAYLYFAFCVLMEQFGNFALNYTDGFTNPVPTLFCVFFYALSFIFFGISLKHLNMGLAYAIWTGVSVIFLAAVSVSVFHQQLTVHDYIGLAIILVGVIGMNLWGTEE